MRAEVGWGWSRVEGVEVNEFALSLHAVFRRACLNLTRIYVRPDLRELMISFSVHISTYLLVGVHDLVHVFVGVIPLFRHLPCPTSRSSTNSNFCRNIGMSK